MFTRTLPWLAALALAFLWTSLARAGDPAEASAAAAAFEAGRWAEAAERYERLVAASPRDVSAGLRLALARLEAGAFEPARAALARVEALDGASARVEFVRGRIALAAGEFEAARAAFAAVRAKDPTYEPAWTPQNLGYALHRLGRHAEAQAALQEALARPASATAPRMWLNAARVALALEQGPEARRLLTEGRAAFPESMWLADLHGWALTLAGDAAGAEAAYARARSLAGLPEKDVAFFTDRIPPTVGLPLAGRVKVLQGPLGAFSHRSLRNACAVDLVGLDEQGREGGPGRADASQGRRVLAALDGEVFLVHDAVPNNRPGERTSAEPRGNHVYLRHAAGLYTRYFHLERGSIAVRPGQRVRTGDVLGRCGNTGWSTRAHLCFAVASSAPEDDLSIPFMCGPCRVTEGGRERDAQHVEPVEGLLLAPPR